MTDVDGVTFEEVSIYSLIEAFREVLDTASNRKGLHIIPDHGRVEDKIDELLTLLAERQSVYFTELFFPESERREIILTFIALLELVRLQAIRLLQAYAHGAVLCQVTERFAAESELLRAEVLSSVTGRPALPTGLEADEAPPEDPRQGKLI